MSFAVMTGSPTKSQLHFDTVLEDLVAETKQDEDRYSLAKILFKCLRDYPNRIRQINGSTGDSETNTQVLDKSIRTALAVQAAGLNPQDKVLIISRNHLDLSGAYYGCLLGGFVLFPLHPGITSYELKHYISLSEPRLIFADQDNLTAIEQTLDEINLKIPIIMLGPNINTHRKTLTQFIAGVEDKKLKDYWPINSNDGNNIVMILTTSGSTGHPKAVMLSSIGLIAQISPSRDIYPKTPGLLFCLATAQWISHTIFMTTTPFYDITMLITTEQVSGNHMQALFRKYKPIFLLITPPILAILAQQCDGDLSFLSSLERFCTGGSLLTEPLYRMIKAHLRPGTKVHNIYGLTETYGINFYTDENTSYMSPGKIFNTKLFKIVDESGNTLAHNQPGELCLRSQYVSFKGYLNNEKATKESLTEDGWFKTGDKFYVDETGDFYFIERINFMIKFLGTKMSPTELESVICDVVGVESAAVCDTIKGPGALVKVKPDFDLNAQTIHDYLKSSLSEYKRLRGGIAFVSSIPLLPNGKIDRNKIKIAFKNTSVNDIHYDIFLK